jgi:competence protein ComEC
VDRVIISHGDNDHIGGFDSFRAAMSIDAVQVGVPGLIAGAAPCLAGQHWRWDGVTFRILHPPADPAFHRNDRSCVLRVTAPGGTVLIPGDIERRSEAALLRGDPRRLAADILVAPHHGSTTSSTQAFVRAVHPHYVLYPVGYRNRFGFPRPEVTARYRVEGAQRFDTARNGAIIFDIKAAGIPAPVTWRQSARRYWNRPGEQLRQGAQGGAAPVSGGG